MKIRSPGHCLCAAFIAMLFAGSFFALANSADWPRFHGSNHDNKSSASGLLKEWPEEGPRLLWQADGLGHGYSSVTVANGNVYTAGMREKTTFVTALDREGKQLWTAQNGGSWEASDRQRWAVPYSGARSTPTVDGDSVYHLGELGSLAAFDRTTGAVQWQRNIMTEFEGQRPEYGYSESVLISGDLLVCSPAGSGAYIAAFDKKTGKTVWTNRDLQDTVGYTSPVPAEIHGVKQFLTFSSDNAFAVDALSGRLLWKHAVRNKRTNNASDALVIGTSVLISSGYGWGSVMIDLERTENGEFDAKVRWQNSDLDNLHGGVIALDNLIFGASDASSRWTAVNPADGKTLWTAPGKGSLTYADGLFYCLDEKGTMTLVNPSVEQWEPVSSFKVPRGGAGPFWAHSVVVGKRLYIRHSGTLFVYSVE